MVILAVGDIVNGVSASGAYQYFQPSGATEVMITFCGGKVVGYAGLSDGVTAQTTIEAGDSALTAEGANCKIAINNTNYLAYYASTQPSVYSGIVIK